ncbi:MAG: phage holin, LLH family [Lachnotalea sp.]
MQMLKTILENWLIIVIIILMVLEAVWFILVFLKLTPKQQIERVQRALLYLVTEAEKQLKSNTGKAKRSLVWNWIKEKFPIISIFITEAQYDTILDKALEELRTLLETNSSLYDYVYGTTTITGEETEAELLTKAVEGK